MTKRLFDIAIGGALLLLLLPIVALIALAVRISMGSPVFFRQQRPGLHGRPFHIIKFRTMREAKDGAHVADLRRVTPLGKFLRSTSLDELPELWNVLKGDMSLVGPRPLLMDYLSLYTSAEMRRHDVPPGITGWAQVNGRNAISWHERFALDIWYVDNRTFLLDMKILATTIAMVLNRRGIDSGGEETMPRFTGLADDR